MSMNNIPVCSQKNGKIGPSSSCRSLGRIWYPLFKNTSHWGCFWQLSRGFRACKQPLVQEKTKLVFRGKALSGQKTAGVGDSRVAQHCDLLRSHLLPALPADSLGLTAQTPEPRQGYFRPAFAQGMDFSPLFPAWLAWDGAGIHQHLQELCSSWAMEVDEEL